MPVRHSLPNRKVNLDRAPAPPANGNMYTPAELEAMTADQRLFVAAHPAFFKTAPDDESDDDKEDLEPPLPNLPGGRRNGAPPPGAFPPDKAQDDATAAATDQISQLKMEPGHMEVDKTPPYVKLHRAVDRTAPLETTTSNVFRGWNYKNCPHYEGALGVDIRRWLNTLAINLKGQQAHPDIWHLAGIRLLQGKAYLDFEDSRQLLTPGTNLRPG